MGAAPAAFRAPLLKELDAELSRGDLSMQGGAVGQLAGSIVERRGPPGVET
jgi:hypothetical protein